MGEAGRTLMMGWVVKRIEDVGMTVKMGVPWEIGEEGKARGGDIKVREVWFGG